MQERLVLFKPIPQLKHFFRTMCKKKHNVSPWWKSKWMHTALQESQIRFWFWTICGRLRLRSLLQIAAILFEMTKSDIVQYAENVANTGVFESDVAKSITHSRVWKVSCKNVTNSVVLKDFHANRQKTIAVYNVYQCFERRETNKKQKNHHVVLLRASIYSKQLSISELNSSQMPWQPEVQCEVRAKEVPQLESRWRPAEHSRCWCVQWLIHANPQ